MVLKEDFDEVVLKITADMEDSEICEIMTNSMIIVFAKELASGKSDSEMRMVGEEVANVFADWLKAIGFGRRRLEAISRKLSVYCLGKTVSDSLEDLLEEVSKPKLDSEKASRIVSESRLFAQASLH